MFQPNEPNGLRNIGILWFIVFSLVYCSRSEGADSGYSPSRSGWRLIDTERLDLDYARLDPNSRDPYAPQYTGRWKDRSSLKWRVSILQALYWDNDVHVESLDTGTVKTVGWHWEAGLRINRYFSIFQEHHSRHIMDESPDVNVDGGNKFPVENSYGIRIRLIEEKVGKGLFQ